MKRISDRISAIGESATLAVDAKAKAARAAGHDIIGFGAGEPDFPTPAHIVEAAAADCHDPIYHHYTPTSGLPALRDAIVAKTARDSGFTVPASQVLVTNGAKEAIFNTFAALLDPGDEVIIQAPYWTTYPESISFVGGVPVPVETNIAAGFRVTTDQLDEALTPKTKALLFVSPGNPTGVVYTEDEVREIGNWALEHGLWVVTDEMYEHLVYGGRSQSSLPVVVPDLADRCVVINGVSKSYAMTGWRVGWMLGPADVIDAAANLHSHTTSNVANVSQRAALAALMGDQSCIEEMRSVFDDRRQIIFQMLNDIPGVKCAEPEGAFYAFPSFEDVLGTDIQGRHPATTIELAEVLLDEAKVAVVPGEAFGSPGYLRLSYALDEQQMVEGVTRIAKALA